MIKWVSSVILCFCMQNALAALHLAEETTIPGYVFPNAPSASTKNVSAQSTLVKASSIILSNPAIISKWQDYLTKLESCLPGTYVLTQINPLVAQQYGDTETVKISGKENELCHVTIMYYKEDDPRLFITPKLPSAKPIRYPAGQECILKEDTLKSIAEFDSDILSGREVRISDVDPLSRAMATECQPFVIIEGQKMMLNDT